MADPVTGTSNSSSSQFHVDEALPPPPPPPAPLEPTGSTVEAWGSKGSQPPTPLACESDETVAAHELSNQVALEQSRRAATAKTLHSEVGGELARLAKAHRDPTDMKPSEAAQVFGSPMDHDGLRKVFCEHSREEVRELLANEIKNAWPNASPEEREKTLSTLMTAASRALTYSTAYKMTDAVVSKMRTAASELSTLAHDPAELSSLGKTLAALSVPGASAEQKAKLAQLREVLGLDEPTPMTSFEPAALATRIGARSELVRSATRPFENTGGHRVLSELADQNVDEALKKSLGIQRGSWASAAVDTVKERGEADKKFTEHVKIASGLIAAAASGGIGGLIEGGAAAAYAIGAGSAAIMGTPGVATAWDERTRAAAGESAGTMLQGSAATARSNAKWEAASYAASIVLPGIAAGAVGGKIAHLVHASHAVAHGAVELATHAGVEAMVQQVLSTPPGGDEPGLTAVERARLETGLRSFMALPAADRQAVEKALSDAMKREHLAPDELFAHLAKYLSQHGHEVSRLSPQVIAHGVVQSLEP